MRGKKGMERGKMMGLMMMRDQDSDDDEKERWGRETDRDDGLTIEREWGGRILSFNLCHPSVSSSSFSFFCCINIFPSLLIINRKRHFLDGSSGDWKEHSLEDCLSASNDLNFVGIESVMKCLCYFRMKIGVEMKVCSYALIHLVNEPSSHDDSFPFFQRTFWYSPGRNTWTDPVHDHEEGDLEDQIGHWKHGCK